MKKLALVFSLFAVGAFAETLQGTISDAKCAKAHADASEKSMKCVAGCVKGGQKAVLVSGDKVYEITNQASVAEHLGHKVTVTGKVDGDKVTVEKVSM